MSKITFMKDGVDITEGIELRGKSNPFGWSVYEVFYVFDVETDAGTVRNEERVGQLYCGEPKDLQSGWSCRIE